MSLGLFSLLTAAVVFNVFLFCGGGSLVAPETEQDGTDYEQPLPTGR